MTNGKDDCCSIARHFVYRRHVALRGQLCVPQESSFPDPQEHIDVNRQTETKLDNSEERSVGDCWNVDGNRTLSDDSIGFTCIHCPKIRPPKGHERLNERLTKAQQHKEARVNMSRIVDHHTMSKKAKKAGNIGNKENPQGMLHANLEVPSTLFGNTKVTKTALETRKKKLERPAAPAEKPIEVPSWCGGQSRW